jgi:L-alanine-DL-glutamate epimerase-like enolase superfamily enzyme
MRHIQSIELESLHIPFTRAFRHAAAERAETATMWATVRLESGEAGCGESCPREYVTGESLPTALAFGAAIASSLKEGVTDVGSLREWMAAHEPEIDRNPAAWCAIELAVIDAFARAAAQSVESLVGLPAVDGEFVYTAVLGDASPDAFAAAVRKYQEFGFSTFKVKLSGDLERDRAKLATFRALSTAATIRVDANNLWRSADEAMRFLSALDCPLFAVEEPVGAGQYDALARIGDALNCRIVLDESVLRPAQLAELPLPAARWIANLRVSKMGGLLRSLALVEHLRRGGLGVIVGAHVGETSLLTRAALPVARAAGAALVAQEGAFGTWLLTRDVCEPPLMFARGGVLRTEAFPQLRQPGFGIACSGRGSR